MIILGEIYGETSIERVENINYRGGRFYWITSTGETYGTAQYFPMDEKHPGVAQSPYAASKIAVDQMALSFFRSFELPVKIIRPFNTYGKGLNEELLIPTVISGAKKGKIIVDDQRPKRDYLYISDFVDLLSGLSVYDQAGCEIFNAGSGVSHSVEEIIETVCSMYDHEIEIHSRNKERENEIFETRADISKAMKLLNWKPAVSLVEGLELIISSEIA